MSRPAVALLWVLLASPLAAQRSSLDRLFTELPFSDWMKAQGQQIGIRWLVRTPAPVLSYHQRLLGQVQVQLDGADLAPRRGRGEIVVMVEITDSSGARYQDHGAIDLRKVEEGVKASNIVYSQYFFVLPGEYQVAVAIYDSESKEHGARRSKFRVAPLKNDPLPDSWTGLPPVEVIAPEEPPNSWYLPGVRGQARLKIEPKRPARIEVIVNLTASEQSRGPLAGQDRNLGALLPTLKVVASAERSQASMQVKMLDLTRQTVAYRQDVAGALDWEAMKDGLGSADPGKIDVKSLEQRHQQGPFFVAEVMRSIRAASTGGGACAVVVLTNPVAFRSQQEVAEIPVSEGGGCRIYYLRFQRQMHLRVVPGMEGGMRRRRGAVGPPGFGGDPRIVVDELAGPLKALSPRIFDVQTPEQARKALAAILADLSET